MSLYDRILGHPFVYNQIRPRVVGGIDASPIYQRLDAGPESVVLDLGCGTGVALDYIGEVKSYLGVDVDEVALRYARSRHGNKRNVRFECKWLGEGDVRDLAPTHVVMGGLLHHLSDDEAISLLRMVKASPRLERIVTNDIVYLPGEIVNNLFARLDRGRHCRHREGYEALVRSAGYSLVESRIVRSHPERGLVKYLLMCVEPSPALERPV